MIEIIGVQIVGILFGLFMVYYIFLHFKRKELKASEFGFWLVLWVLFTLVVFFPAILEPLRKAVGFVRVMDMLVVFGFIFLIGLTFYNYITLRKNQKKIEDVVREITILPVVKEDGTLEGIVRKNRIFEEMFQ